KITFDVNLTKVVSLLDMTIEDRRGEARSGGTILDKTFPFAYSSLRLLITGPVSHYFYQPMVPITVPYCMVKRLLLDRLIALPVFLLGKRWADFQSKVNSSYWPALKMNWKVWTPFQFININYVAVEFRVLFANMVALFWYAYLASVRK
uniref:Peroxisomal membrane protein 2 n=1 Tax=Hucho hucho TaxID=62062 RepID=A0A4W5M0S4_9TELE